MINLRRVYNRLMPKINQLLDNKNVESISYDFSKPTYAFGFSSINIFIHLVDNKIKTFLILGDNKNQFCQQIKALYQFVKSIEELWNLFHCIKRYLFKSVTI